MPYKHRVVDKELKDSLAAAGAVLIEGPRACGKTETARQAAVSEVLLDVDHNARAAATIAPELILTGDVPRLIDEWQLAPTLWDQVRRAVDSRRETGQFILTGSSVPADEVTRHTGAGRILRLRMRPMSLFESGHSTGTVSLADLLTSGPNACADPGLTIHDIAQRVAIGGWPSLQERTTAESLKVTRGYLDDVRRADMARIGQGRRDPRRIARVLKSLARHVATAAKTNAIARDSGGADGPLDEQTVAGYVALLERLMVVEDLPAWAPHLRSRSVLRTAAKRHFVDPSLAVAALGATPARLLAKEIKWLGLLFESLVVRDLRIYAQANDASVSYYQDNTGLEVDAIVQTAAGDWAAFEVKLGQSQVDEAAANLLTLAGRVDTTVCGKPTTLAVITATGYGYVRGDGVAVVPIGGLRP